MLKIIAIVIALIIVSILIFAATRPDAFLVERATNITAPPERIYALINDFHQWETWSPWEKVDPAVKRSFSGAPNGAGAVYEYSGNKELGKGRLEIVESSPSKIVIDIQFLEPFAARNTVEFTLATQGDTTTLTQAMYGENSYLSKLMCLFFDSEKMIGQKYEEGLASLKTLAEKSG